MGYTLLIRDRDDRVWQTGDVFKVLPRKWKLALPQKCLRIKVLFGDYREARRDYTQSLFGKYRRRYKVNIDDYRFKKNVAWVFKMKNLIDKEIEDGNNADND